MNIQITPEFPYHPRLTNQQDGQFASQVIGKLAFNLVRTFPNCLSSNVLSNDKSSKPRSVVSFYTTSLSPVLSSNAKTLNITVL